MDRIYPQLFEYAVIVGLCAKTDDPGYEPYIIHKFPQTVSWMKLNSFDGISPPPHPPPPAPPPPPPHVVVELVLISSAEYWAVYTACINLWA